MPDFFPLADLQVWRAAEAQRQERERTERADDIASSKRWLADHLDTEFWISLCWRSPAERDEFLAQTSADEILIDGKHLEGRAFAALVGAEI